MMKCPRCKSFSQGTTDSRERFRGWVRVRRCYDCGFKFKTVEQYAEETPKPTKHDIDVNRVKEMAANMGIKLMEE